jgi:hypothetical protein
MNIMEKRFITGQNITSGGTSRQGTFKGTYREIVEVLGEPNFVSEANGDGKTQAEWNIKYIDGTVITLYDYKKYNTDVEDVTTWSIGGFDGKSVDALELIFMYNPYVEITHDRW